MSTNISIRLGKNISEARKASGKTQAEVAEKVGIDTVSLSRIERGTVTPSITTLDRIADALGEPLGKLFDGVSSHTAALADNVAVLLENLSEEDRIFLLEQLHVWAERLVKHKTDNCTKLSEYCQKHRCPQWPAGCNKYLAGNE